MIQPHRRGRRGIGPVGDDGTVAEFPHAAALLVFVEIAPADQHVETGTTILHLVEGDYVDLALGAVAG